MPVPVEIMRRIIDPERGLGMDALVVYGLTEATGGTHWTRSGDPIEKRVATVGLRTSEIEDRVVDPATGELDGFWKPLSGFAVQWLAPALSGKFIVISSIRAADELSGR